MDARLRRSLLDGTSLDAGELVCTTDENNVPTDTGHARNEVRLRNLWHRATYLVVRCREGDRQDDAAFHNIVIQRRSKLKDYCPGKLDPAPGGVVGFGESCFHNAQRELLEEMGIDVRVDNTNTNTMTRLFTFPYQDDRVKCWGELYEVLYTGSLSDMTLQPEEVEEVTSVPLSKLAAEINNHNILNINNNNNNNNEEWTQDGLHALRLYLQYQHDVITRQYRGHSSLTELDSPYELRRKPKVLFFDCDDCLYFNDWNTADRLTKKIDAWCRQHLTDFPPGEAYRLYQTHGTALRGLLEEKLLHRDGVDGYLRDVHDVPLDDVRPDPALRALLSRLDPAIPRYVFTASVADHAERCLAALGVRDLFEDVVVDTQQCDLHTKHSDHSFRAAMRVAGVTEPRDCLLLDDSLKNIEAARAMGWRSVLVGRKGRDCGTPVTSHGHAEFEVDRIHDLEKILPELFVHEEEGVKE